MIRFEERLEIFTVIRKDGAGSENGGRRRKSLLTKSNRRICSADKLSALEVLFWTRRERREYEKLDRDRSIEVAQLLGL